MWHEIVHVLCYKYLWTLLVKAGKPLPGAEKTYEFEVMWYSVSVQLKPSWDWNSLQKQVAVYSFVNADMFENRWISILRVC